ncbi:MAG: GIY-YIG nuclease family protein [Bdellovibrionales bacterium]
MDKDDLLRLIADDDTGLLQVRPKATGAVTADERLVSSFDEIKQFVSEKGREPTAGNGVQEHRLYARLKGFRESKEKIEALKPLDALGLLPDQVREIKTINDIFDDDDLGILKDDAESIFTLKHVPKDIEQPDFIAQREPCADFADFEEKLKQCQADLTARKRKLLPFRNEQDIHEGFFFVLRGVLLYVAKVAEREVINGKTNARLRCIFENGTESNMLLRSLARELYKDGRRVTEHGDRLLAGFDNITAEDQESGYIYVLRSLNQKPEIQSVHNLYKIGFSRVPVEERIKNAAEEPTYLMAPVKIVTVYQCYNMNPQKLELLLHTFFGSSCLNIDIFDGAGQRHTPREWFIAPLEIIEQAIHFLLNGEIVNYRYDPERQEIVGR